MIIFFLVVSGFLIGVILYRKYLSLRAVPCNKNIYDKTGIVVLDIRNYNIDTHNKESDIRIPYAYMKRFIKEIPKQDLHLVANDRLELFLGLRYLMRNGYDVVSYRINNCPCDGKE